METLLGQYHADVNAVHGDKTPLIKAVMSGVVAAVEQVLSRSELDLKHLNQGNTALWYSTSQQLPSGCFTNRGSTSTVRCNEAVIHNNTAVVKVILADERTDPNIAAENMRTPLLCATDQGHLGMVKTLLGDPRVDPVCRDARGWSALHYTAEHGNVQIVDLLLADDRIDVNAQNHHGSTALHLAAQRRLDM